LDGWLAGWDASLGGDVLLDQKRSFFVFVYLTVKNKVIMAQAFSKRNKKK
jgi:hypothetical protein